jgi:hypothetical protein
MLQLYGKRAAAHSTYDASMLSTDTAGGFLGATFGPYAHSR